MVRNMSFTGLVAWLDDTGVQGNNTAKPNVHGVQNQWLFNKLGSV